MSEDLISRDAVSATPNPCEDAISRQAALDAVCEIECSIKHKDCTLHTGCCFVAQALVDLPPVTPKQRTGHWIKHNTFERWECSCCGVQFRFSFKEHYFCPNCGANVEEQK